MSNIQDYFEDAARQGDGAFAIAYSLILLGHRISDIGKILEVLAENVRSYHPLQTQTFDDIGGALSHIGAALEQIAWLSRRRARDERAPRFPRESSGRPAHGCLRRSSRTAITTITAHTPRR